MICEVLPIGPVDRLSSGDQCKGDCGSQGRILAVSADK